MGENRSDEWRGWRFVVVSLVVTMTCSIFFFAGRHFFPTIVERARFAWGIMSQRVIEWGGVRLESIELQVLLDQAGGNITDQGKVMEPFGSLANQMSTELSSYRGSPFWALDLGQVKNKILDAGWVKSVYLRRSFPNALKIQIVPRTPVLLVRNSTAWVAIDDEGSPVLISGQVPGAWLGLPIVYGLESVFDRGRTITETRRLAGEEAGILKDIDQLVMNLKSKLGVEVESVLVKEESWTKSALLTTRFSLARQKSVPDGKNSETKYQVTFLANDWSARISALQYVLSDLSSKNLDEVRVLGQYSGRWIVEDLSPSANENHKVVAKRVVKKKIRGTSARRRH